MKNTQKAPIKELDCGGLRRFGPPKGSAWDTYA